MKDNDRALRIVDRLTELTSAGDVKWARGRVKSAFLLEVGKERVRISSIDHDDGPPFLFSIHNAEGQKVAEVRSEPARAGGGEADSNAKLATLFALARSSALGVDDVLKNLEQELGL
jgi:hypothetical protein